MLGIDPGVFQAADKFFSNPIGVQKRKAKSKKSAAEKPKVLVVDDQPMVADTTVEILNRSGFRAVHAYNGQTALRIAAKLQPDYLLADVLMPLMNGVELAIAITRMLPATKIVLFSGQAGIADILRQGREEGYVFDLIAKPIHPEKLIEHLKRK